ncbi:uncharacterized protein LOC142985336 [Anticarsia gemmatalis]|uniref:uncharacterized protein LOC142985336 n=1 Tax=Anticarsia gemmatalis TaxID=129554 RepID=UPI003F76DCDA
MTPWQNWGPQNNYSRPGKRRFDEINYTIDALRQELALNEFVIHSELETRFYSDYERSMIAAEMYKDRLLALTESARSQIVQLQTGMPCGNYQSEYDRYGPKRTKFNHGATYYNNYNRNQYPSPQSSRSGYSYNSQYKSPPSSYNRFNRKRKAQPYRTPPNAKRYTPMKPNTVYSKTNTEQNNAKKTNSTVKTFTATSAIVSKRTTTNTKMTDTKSNDTKTVSNTTGTSKDSIKTTVTSIAKTVPVSSQIGQPIPIVVTTNSTMIPTVTLPTTVPIKIEQNISQNISSLFSNNLSPIKLRFSDKDKIVIKTEGIKAEIRDDSMTDDLENHI